MFWWSTFQLLFFNFSQKFWSLNIPVTPGCASVVFAENEIWNRLKQFLPVCLYATGPLKEFDIIYQQPLKPDDAKCQTFKKSPRIIQQSRGDKNLWSIQGQLSTLWLWFTKNQTIAKLLKVRKFQNENTKLSHCWLLKYERKNNKNYALKQNFSNLFVHILVDAIVVWYRR